MDGQTGFMYACINNSVNTVQFLIKTCPLIVDQRDNYRDTGFISACKYGAMQIVELLVDKFSDIIY